MKRVLNNDPLTATRTYFHLEPGGETFGIETEQDCGPIIELNKELYNSHDENDRWPDGMAHVATLPDTFYWKLRRRYKTTRADGTIEIDHAAADAELMKLLDDSAYQAFRVRPGKLTK